MSTAQAAEVPIVSYKLMHPTSEAMRMLRLFSSEEVENLGVKYIGAIATCKRDGLARNKTGLGWRYVTCAVKTSHGYRFIVKWTVNEKAAAGVVFKITRIA